MAKSNKDVGMWDICRTLVAGIAGRAKKAEWDLGAVAAKVWSVLMMPAVCIAFVSICWLVGLLGAVGLDSGYSAGAVAMSMWKDERGAKEMMEVARCDASRFFGAVEGKSLAACWVNSEGRQFIVALEGRLLGCEAGVCRLRYSHGSGAIEYVELDGQSWHPAEVGRLSLAAARAFASGTVGSDEAMSGHELAWSSLWSSNAVIPKGWTHAWYFLDGLMAVFQALLVLGMACFIYAAAKRLCEVMSAAKKKALGMALAWGGLGDMEELRSKALADKCARELDAEVQKGEPENLGSSKRL